MNEIRTPLTRLMPGDKYIAKGDDETVIITPEHTHCDILRYVVADVGKEHAREILDML